MYFVIWVGIGIWCFSEGNTAGVFCALFFIVIRLLFDFIMWAAYEIDSKMHVMPSPRFSDTEDDESPFIRTGGFMDIGNVVDDPLEGPLLINHDDKILEDRYGNKRYDLEEINEAYVKDSRGHIYIRNKYI